MPKLDRLHTALAVLITLGVGYRAFDNHKRVAGNEQPALRAQIERTGRSGKAPARERPHRKAAEKRPSASTESGVRAEQTPAGALARVTVPKQQTVVGATVERVDMDQASERVLEALPGIGPSLARRLARDRESNGPFGSLAGLQRVKGVGPRLAERLAPYVTFGGTGRPSNVISIPEPAHAGSQDGARRREGRNRLRSR